MNNATPYPNRVLDAHARPVFVYPGQGPQWWAMGRELFATYPVFRDTLTKCDREIKRLAGWSLSSELSATQVDSRIDRDFEVSQPSLVAFQIALTDLWRYWQITPAAVIGHSMGEISAAYAAGVLTLTDALRVITNQGRLLQQTAGMGRMVAVEASLDSLAPLLDNYVDTISVAAINSPNSTVLSGDCQAIEEMSALLTAKGHFCRILHTTGVAGHSYIMYRVKDQLSDSLTGLTPSPATVPIYSTLFGRLSRGEEFTARYWGENVSNTVQFAAAIDAIIAAGLETFLEISPHPVLALPISRCYQSHGRCSQIVSSLQRERSEVKAIEEARAQLSSLIEAQGDISCREGFVEELNSAASGERLRLITEKLRAVVARVLRVSRPDDIELTRGLFELGLDSVKALELAQGLSRELGRPVAATIAFEYPNVAALAEYYYTSYFGGARHELEQCELTDDVEFNYDDLSQSELEALLGEELAHIERMMGDDGDG